MRPASRRRTRPACSPRPPSRSTRPTRRGRAGAGHSGRWVGDMLGFGMTILIFMMIVIYGKWIAMSVVEEKSSRVMEVVLNAATPFELLSGKVLGVGAVALTQYAALLLAGGAAVLAQGTVAGLVLGSGARRALPQGLTIELLLALRRLRRARLPALRRALCGGGVARQPPGRRQRGRHADDADRDRRLPRRRLLGDRAHRRPVRRDGRPRAGAVRQPVHDAQSDHVRPGRGLGGRPVDRACSSSPSWPRCGSRPASTGPGSSCTASARAPATCGDWSGPAPDRSGLPRHPGHEPARIAQRAPICPSK